MEQEYELGQFLKDRYVNEYKLLNSTYLLKEVHVDSLSLNSWFILYQRIILIIILHNFTSHITPLAMSMKQSNQLFCIAL